MIKAKDTIKPINIEKELCWPEPWEQLNDESDKAYGAFQTYLNLGMGYRTYVAAAEKLGKRRNYEAVLRQWASKYQWRARCQAFDAARLEKEREDAEQARLQIFATRFTLGHYFFEHVGEDLKRQWQGTQINPETGEEEPYKKPNSFSINQKLKILTWAYDVAVKNAVEKKSVLLEIGTKALKDNALNEAFDEILVEDPDLHDACVKLIGRALRRANGLDREDSKR
ncbi:MAG TPA: hypothetical protein VEF35_03985 [Candidatus Bathyarchaeia archaeon]|nr:hypothetical protein [Candidatus Bathyarchaeia archaeon]